NDFDAEYSFIDNIGPIFYFRTDLRAPRGRIIAINITKPARENWQEILPQSADRMQSANVINDQFIALYLKDAHSEARIFDLKGRLLRRLELPGIGSAGGFGGKRTDTETFYSFTSFTVPATIYRADLRAGTSAVFRR